MPGSRSSRRTSGATPPLRTAASASANKSSALCAASRPSASALRLAFAATPFSRIASSIDSSDDRQQALLRREPDHHQIGEDRIAEQPRRQRAGAQRRDIGGRDALADRGEEARRRQDRGCGWSGTRRSARHPRSPPPRCPAAPARARRAPSRRSGRRRSARRPARCPAAPRGSPRYRRRSRMWLVTAPPFCAMPVMSSTLALLPSRCAAIARIAPTVSTPVPPMPVTSSACGASLTSRTAGTGSAAVRAAERRVDRGCA